MILLESHTMEEVFIVTGIFILLLGVAIGLLIWWIFEKENERGAKDGK